MDLKVFILNNLLNLFKLFDKPSFINCPYHRHYHYHGILPKVSFCYESLSVFYSDDTSVPRLLLPISLLQI